MPDRSRTVIQLFPDPDSGVALLPVTIAGAVTLTAILIPELPRSLIRPTTLQDLAFQDLLPLRNLPGEGFFLAGISMLGQPFPSLPVAVSGTPQFLQVDLLLGGDFVTLLEDIQFDPSSGILTLVDP